MSAYRKNLEYTFSHFLINSDLSEFKPVIYEKNEFIIRSGDSLDCFYFLLSGKIRIFQDYENGKRMLIRIFDSYTVLGDIEYFQKIPAMSSCQCVEEVKVLKIPYNYIDSKYSDNLTFLKNILLQQSEKVLLTNEQAILNNIYSLETRLSSYILSLLGDDNSVDIPPLTDVADHLGTSYRHLTRTIKNLRELGVIMKKNKRIRVLDREELLKLSKGNVYERKIKIT